MNLSVTDVGKFMVFKLIGLIDWEDARRLNQEIHRIIDEVTFIRSGGIGVLVYNLNKVKQKGGAICII